MNRIEEVKKILKNRIKASSFDSRDTQIWGIDESAEQINQLYNEPDQDEIERDKISKSNAIGMGLIPPDQSRLLTPEVMDAIRAKWYNEDKGETRRFVNLVKMSAEAQLAKDDARIEALIEEVVQGIEGFIQSPKMPNELSLCIKVWVETFKATHCKGKER